MVTETGEKLMNTATQALIERVRKTTETHTDYAVAKALGISYQRVYGYSSGANELRDASTITRAAELIGDDPSAVLAEFQAETEKSEKARFYWRRLATLAREHAAACLIAAVSAGATMSPSPASANAVSTCFGCGSATPGALC